MKILLVTLHSQNNNFGSVLQSYSLYHYLEEKGYEVEVLDYRPYYSNGAKNLIKRIRGMIVNLTFLPYYIKRTKRFNRFVVTQKLTKRFKTISELKSHVFDTDVFMIGSDQVWNTKYLCGNDPVYHLKFTQSKNKMSYAASLGSKVENSDQLTTLISNLSGFKFIALREKYSSIELQNAGLQNAKYVLDPVFLHDYFYYRKIQSNQNTISGYILAYIIHEDPFMRSVVDYISKKLNKKVIQIGGFRSKCNNSHFFRSIGPEMFLEYIDKADFIITSSFHGLAFSHIYNKQFAVVMPEDNTLRLENILQTAGTEDRVITSISQIDNLLSQTINYGNVNCNIYKVKEDSENYINEALTQFSNDRNM